MNPASKSFLMQKRNSVILIDADVISHFISGNQISILPTIFKYKIIVIDIVYQEICNIPGKRTEIDKRSTKFERL